jgi:CRP/FNR family transcriptional regulator, cyclic AMP receptor protein
MFTPELLNDGSLEKYVRHLSSGESLFKQGEHGNSMFLIVEGLVKVFNKNTQNSIERMVGICCAGEVIGEKAILTTKPYRRNLSAEAKTACTLLELDNTNIQAVISKTTEFHMKLMRIMASRLDEANEYVQILQRNDPMDRLSNYLVSFHNAHKKKGIPISQITWTEKDIRFGANVDKVFAEDCVKLLLQKKILMNSKDGFYLADEEALMKYVPTLRERVAA